MPKYPMENPKYWEDFLAHRAEDIETVLKAYPGKGRDLEGFLVDDGYGSDDEMYRYCQLNNALDFYLSEIEDA